MYIGETGTTLRKQLTKHKAAVKKCDNKNGSAVHTWKSGHQVEWVSAKVKEVVPNLAHRRITGLWPDLRQYLVPPPNMTPSPLIF